MRDMAIFFNYLFLKKLVLGNLYSWENPNGDYCCLTLGFWTLQNFTDQVFDFDDSNLDHTMSPPI